MKYRVTKQYARGTETLFAEFEELNDAKLFVQSKLKEDAALKVKVIYRITEFGETIEEFDPNNASIAAQISESQSSQGGRTSTSSFTPTPFNTTPTPTGMPKQWIKDKDDDKDGKK